MAVSEQAHDVSDDEFDVVDVTESVSDLSTPTDEPSRPWQLPSDHYGRSFDAGQAAESEYPRNVVTPRTPDLPGDSHPTGPTSTADNDGAGSYQGKEKLSALNYTKSMVRRFMAGQEELLIAVMGMTGAGKTTFISKVTGRTDLKIGHSLTSCTRDIETIETEIDGRLVRFVDTPGFSDTNLSDGEVLQLIAEYLAVAYKKDMKLSGIIYLHPISDTRMTHHATKNLQMFQKLTGEKNLKNVILATSMWDKVSPEEGLAREVELKTKFWTMLLAFGARATQYKGTAESARSIAHMLMANKPFFVQLQTEMGQDNKALRDTSAGRQIMTELVKIKEEHKRELADMEEMMKNSAEENKLVVETLKKHYQGLVKNLEKTLRDERQLNEEAVNSLRERVNALEGRRCVVM
ncbi:P-loop containing nucleoside triphosphate hydrolase protein [Xylaria intraflava]|nr:P-loop containing nucleoside triphosphate hydrolase protein [Xylaria intraflava]